MGQCTHVAAGGGVLLITVLIPDPRSAGRQEITMKARAVASESDRKRGFT